MKRSIFAGLICLAAPALFSLPIPSLAEQSPDVKTDEVVVTAARIPQRVEDVLADMTVIEREEIERAGQSTLIELLQMQPGVEITSNGGAGKQTGIFLRGTNNDHVVVLVDGLRVNSATSGTTAFESMALGQIERIEILRGSASSLYGADALGGVIQIFTKRAEKGIHYSAFLGYGHYNTKRAEAGVSGGNENTRFALNASGLKTDGFSAKNITTGFDADNDPYRNLAVSGSLTQNIAEGHELEAQFLQNKGRNNYDCNNAVCFTDQTLLGYGLTSRNRFLSFWNSTLKFGIGVDDSTNHAGAALSTFRTEQRQITWQNDVTLPLGTLTLAYDRLEQEVSGTTNYTVKSRDNDGWLASYVLDAAAHSVQASARRDLNSQYGGHTTGGLGYGYRITPQWRASAGFGTAFKAPSFNQLYFPNFGDPALQPETSRNRETALRYDNRVVKAGLTVFDNEIRNLIEFSGAATAGCTLGGFCPVNVGKAEIRGATFDGGWFINDHWTLRGNFTVQSPKNQATDKLLIRRGQRYGALDLNWQAGAFQAGVELQGAAERYNNATNTKRMGGYTLANLTASYAFHPDWKLEARANNIFDKDYVLAYVGNTATSAAYETPGANIFIGVRWQPE